MVVGTGFISFSRQKRWHDDNVSEAEVDGPGPCNNDMDHCTPGAPRVVLQPTGASTSAQATADQHESTGEQACQRMQESLDVGLLSRATLGDRERKTILQQKWKQFTYPRNPKNRKYSPAWEEKFSWLRYSQSKDAAYCSVCVCFAPQEQSNPEFVSKPFCDWKNACGQERGALRRHDNSDTHQAALKMAEDFLMICQEERKPITGYISQAYEQKIEKNRHALLCILDVIISLAKRGIPLRPSWCKERQEEDSNFNFFIKWKAEDKC